MISLKEIGWEVPSVEALEAEYSEEISVEVASDVELPLTEPLEDVVEGPL